MADNRLWVEVNSVNGQLSILHLPGELPGETDRSAQCLRLLQGLFSLLSETHGSEVVCETLLFVQGLQGHSRSTDAEVKRLRLRLLCP